MRTKDDIVKELRGMITAECPARSLAKQFGISPSFLSEILSGKRQINTSVLMGMGYDPEPRYVRP